MLPALTDEQLIERRHRIADAVLLGVQYAACQTMFVAAGHGMGPIGPCTGWIVREALAGASKRESLAGACLVGAIMVTALGVLGMFKLPKIVRAVVSPVIAAIVIAAVGVAAVLASEATIDDRDMQRIVIVTGLPAIAVLMVIVPKSVLSFLK